ncbi:NAD-dependent epimerase/dehydratase family protein [Sphingomonas asaccharolytica]|uniref:NAD-dependent epimerase/dehydratase family protein n=1 Tax=Sphingomonas asaccharolytica TaxID=40681 RepID=UPI00082F6111|nr:NAD(P)-dependent oxidoreductase [Sphingomonas asaccharolytica]
MRAHHLIVTGGGGYIGARLIEFALAQGRTVTVLGRRPGPAGSTHLQWALGDPLPAGLPLVEGSALVHLAHDWRAEAEDNVAGTATLFASARDTGVAARVFISSQSARSDALNLYGRMKWAAEQCIVGATSLRVGLVYGGPRQAMYGLLCRLARLPILPMIDPKRAVQPIHLDEVIRGILAAADGRACGVLALAGPDRIAFGDVLRALAMAYGGKRLPILPVPLNLALLACKISAHVPLMPTIDKERVLGLAGTEPIESAMDLVRLGVDVQPMTARLTQEPAGRRAVLDEGRYFMRYLGVRPTPALLRRYARAVPDGAIARPHWGMRWREPLSGTSPLGQRLRVAARIAEASAPGEKVLSGESRAGRLLGLAFQGLVELLLLPTRMLASLGR